MNMQFKTNSKHRARGFNCTVYCDPLNFLALFSRKEPEPNYDDPGTTLPPPDYEYESAEYQENTSQEELFTATERDPSLDDHVPEDPSVFNITEYQVYEYETAEQPTDDYQEQLFTATERDPSIDDHVPEDPSVFNITE